MPPLVVTLLPAVAGFLSFGGVLALVFGLASLRRDPVKERLEQATRQVRSMEEIEMEAPLKERLLKPFEAQLARLIARVTPSGLQDSTRQRLLTAGLGGEMDVADFMGMKGVVSLICAGVVVLLVLLLKPGTVLVVVMVALALLVGYFGPDLWLRDKISKRKRAVVNGLPDLVDLLTVSVEAGLGFDQALARIVSKSDTILSREFIRVLQEMRVGVSRRDALRALAERTGVDDIHIFVTAIIQAERLGASVGAVLRVQSSEMRLRRRQRAETLAHQAPIKMLFPMAFLIFPPIFIVVLGPAVPRLLRLFAPNISL